MDDTNKKDLEKWQEKQNREKEKKKKTKIFKQENRKLDLLIAESERQFEILKEMVEVEEIHIPRYKSSTSKNQSFSNKSQKM